MRATSGGRPELRSVLHSRGEASFFLFLILPEHPEATLKQKKKGQFKASLHQVCVCVCRSIMASATLINTYPDVRIFFQEYSVVNDALKILVLEKLVLGSMTSMTSLTLLH